MNVLGTPTQIKKPDVSNMGRMFEMVIAQELEITQRDGGVSEVSSPIVDRILGNK